MAKTKRSKAKVVMVGDIPVRRVTTAEHRRLNKRIKKRIEKWRNRYREIRGKKIDYVTHSYEDGCFYINLYFTDKTNFSLDFAIAEPAIVPFAIEYGDVSTGDYENIKTYFMRRR